MAEKQSVTRPVDLERHFSRRNPIVEGLLQTGGKAVSPVYDAASYLLNQVGLNTPSFEQYTGIKPFGFEPGMSGESPFFTPPKTNYPPKTQIIPAIPGRPGTEVGAGMPLPPLKQKMDQANATGTPSVMPYVAAGTDQGQNARERSFLERMSQSGLLSTLQGMARAERQYGVGPLAAFSESALDVQAARAAAAQKQREMGLELAKEQLKAGDGGADYRKSLGTSVVQDLLQSAGSTFGAVNTIQEINKFLASNNASGAGASAARLATQLGNLFGLNLETAAQEKVSNLADMIKSSLAESRLFGRDLSKADYEILAQIIQKPGLLTSSETIRDQYKRVADKMSSAHSRKVRSLVDIFGGGKSGQERAQRLLSTQAMSGNVFTKVE